MYILWLQPRVLKPQSLLTRVVRRHVEGLVDLEKPGAALNGLGGGHFREEPVHAHLHFLFVIRDWDMDLRQAFADLQAQIPSHGRADDARSEVVVAVRGIAEHDGKVLGYVVEKRNQRRSAFEIGRCLEDPVLEDRLVGGESEVLWISGTEETSSGGMTT